MKINLHNYEILYRIILYRQNKNNICVLEWSTFLLSPKFNLFNDINIKKKLMPSRLNAGYFVILILFSRDLNNNKILYDL